MIETVTLNGASLDVTFETVPEYRGARDQYGAPLEPDEPAGIEVISVEYEGADVTGLMFEWDKIGEIEELLKAA